MSLHQFFSILRARRLLAGMILLATLALAAAWIALRPTYYAARAPVLVDVRTDPVGVNALQGMIAPSFMATQIDIVRSERVAQRVVEMLKIDKQPKEIEHWREATDGKGSPQAWFAHELQKKLDVKPARESNIINITWKGKSPDEAARVANSFAQAYLDTSLELKTDPARGYASWFEDQVKTARQNLAAAQGKLSAFQERTGIISADEKGDYETNRLNELSMQLTTVQGLTTESLGKRAAGRDTVADVMQSSLINTLRAEVAKQEGKVQEGAAYLGPNHPQMQRLQAELGALRSRLSSETARISSSVDTSYQVNKSRERELLAALNAQKARVIGLNKERGELSLLQKDVDSAQKAFETVSASASQSRLQSLTNQTNVMRLAPAIEPLEATGPTAVQALLVAAVAGMLLAVAGALMTELVNRRVRSVEDLTMVTQLPILASVPGTGAILVPLRLPYASRRLALAGHRSIA
ncbi:MAG TPA: chain length determinant protein EpsF [Ramlibacter sp.]|nr:chain length determinant protein EpsF [Ramlibacter sp.]